MATFLALSLSLLPSLAVFQASRSTVAKITAVFKHTSFVAVLFCFSFTAKGAVYPMPQVGNDTIGQNFTVTVQHGDSSTTIRQRYEVSLVELIAANPNINFNRLIVGQTILIPRKHILPEYRHGIVINAPELRLYYFSPDGCCVYTYPIGLGRMNWRTPIAATKIVRKQYLPTWYVPNSIRDYMYAAHGKLLPDAVPPGPENPLGEYAFYLEKRGYLIHGTNDQDTVGTFASSGCMRMQSEPIEKLYQLVAIGTPVFIIHHPIKAGWHNNVLYLESHSPVKGYGEQNELDHEDVNTAINRAIANRYARVDWPKVTTVIQAYTGVPTPVGAP